MRRTAMKGKAFKSVWVAAFAVAFVFATVARAANDGEVIPAAATAEVKAQIQANEAVAGRAMGNTNHEARKGSMYAWTGFPGPCHKPSAALILLEKMGPYEVIVGDTFTYRIQISNRTDIDVFSVTLSDVLPDGFEVEKIEPQPVSTSGNEMHWDLGTINARSAKTISITGRATQVGCLVSNGRARICYEMPLPLVTRVIHCDIEVTACLPPEVEICDAIPLEVVVNNTGTGTATGVTARIDLPEGLVTADGRKEIAWNVGSIPVGQAKRYTFRLKAQKTGPFAVPVLAFGDRNCAAAAEASTVVKAAVLYLQITGADKSYIGTKVGYELTVINVGDFDARDVCLVTTFAGPVQPLETSMGRLAKDGKGTFKFGTIPVGESRTVTIAASSTAAGKVFLRGAVGAYCAEEKCAEKVMDVFGVPGILTYLSDDVDPVALNGTTTYTITATNQGTRTSTNLAFTCKLDEGMEFVSGSGATAVTASGDTVTFAPLPSLGMQKSATWKVTVRANTE